MCTLRPCDLRPRQAIGAVGASGRGRTADPDLPGLPTRSPGLGRRLGPVRIVRKHAPVAAARRRGVPGVRPHGTRTSGRLAQLEERRPYKAKVAGSSPAAPTTKPQVKGRDCGRATARSVHITISCWMRNVVRFADGSPSRRPASRGLRRSRWRVRRVRLGTAAARTRPRRSTRRWRSCTESIPTRPPPI